LAQAGPAPLLPSRRKRRAYLQKPRKRGYWGGLPSAGTGRVGVRAPITIPHHAPAISTSVENEAMV
jgi:hypothetical protein